MGWNYKLKILLFAILKTWLLAILTGDRINEGFFYKKMYGLLASPKKSGRSNKLTVYNVAV